MSLFFESVALWLREFCIGELLYDILQGLSYVFAGPYRELSGMFFLTVGVALFMLIIRLIRRFIF